MKFLTIHKGIRLLSRALPLFNTVGRDVLFIGRSSAIPFHFAINFSSSTVSGFVYWQVQVEAVLMTITRNISSLIKKDSNEEAREESAK